MTSTATNTGIGPADSPADTTDTTDTTVSTGSGRPDGLGAEYRDRGALGVEIERLRKIADLTVSALARLAGVSPAVLRRYERGGSGPVELQVLRAIAAGAVAAFGAAGTLAALALIPAGRRLTTPAPPPSGPSPAGPSPAGPSPAGPSPAGPVTAAALPTSGVAR